MNPEPQVVNGTPFKDRMEVLWKDHPFRRHGVQKGPDGDAWFTFDTERYVMQELSLVCGITNKYQ